ncbi:hypothetical protein A6A04_08635 [Paramagnetospirillum marisnigri]|uniref:histidine kinase n=1 Tax=Paramagnetospirillum marisnigri TaxID=1285242 RepID=A0A178M5A5_9PROT|nr:sensor histidine kinase [Paramagnetospirillum marisnigri]OAN43940.1 hypothetical protein A6A04_08635 [Paramagnetospirillum marisnigri]
MTATLDQRDSIQSPKVPMAARKASMVVIALMLVLASVHTWVAWTQSNRAAESLVTTLTRTLEFQTDSTFRSIDNLLLEASQTIDPDHWPKPDQLNWFQSRLVGFPEARNFVVAGIDGKSVGPGLASTGLVGQPIDVSDRQHFRAHRAGLDQGRMLVGDPITDRLDGHQIIPLSRAIRDAKGNFRGMVGLGIDPHYLVEVLESLLIEPAGGISVLRRDGIFLARLPDQYGSFGRSVAKSDLFTKFLASTPHGIARFISVADGNAKIVGYRTLERYPLVVTVGITRTTAFASFWIEFASLAVAITILAVMLFWLASLSDRRAYSRMLLASELEAQSHSLERQVEERTHHLEELRAETEKKARQLATSNADLERFAYIASHDLQEPLRSIASYLQLLQKRYQEQLDDQAREYISYAVGGAKRMHDLIVDLLAYSRVNSQGEPFKPCDLDEVVAEARQNLSIQIKESAAIIEVGELPPLIGDRRQLLSLFQNLMSNAIKYRKPDVAPLIRISATQQDGRWHFRVEDNGIGIEEAYHQRVFVIFQRLHAAGRYEGTGIGLALCKRIVERHGGAIHVESQLGQGASFCFDLPFQPPKD